MVMCKFQRFRGFVVFNLRDMQISGEEGATDRSSQAPAADLDVPLAQEVSDEASTVACGVLR